MHSGIFWLFIGFKKLFQRQMHSGIVLQNPKPTTLDDLGRLQRHPQPSEWDTEISSTRRTNGATPPSRKETSVTLSLCMERPQTDGPDWSARRHHEQPHITIPNSEQTPTLAQTKQRNEAHHDPVVWPVAACVSCSKLLSLRGRTVGTSSNSSSHSCAADVAVVLPKKRSVTTTTTVHPIVRVRCNVSVLAASRGRTDTMSNPLLRNAPTAPTRRGYFHRNQSN